MNFIFKSTLFVFIILINFSGHSQNIIKGRIVDKESGSPIQDVQIKHSKNKMVTISSLDGSFEIRSKGHYNFSKNGYFDLNINVNTNDFLTIELAENPSELNEIIVSANYLPKPIKESSASIHIISSEDINRGNNINFNDILNRTPGVFMQSGALNTNRITIRGIGARNLFGTAKIRAYFKDIPLTSGSGETNIEDFELSSISGLEITKGASSIYGAGLGGTIEFIPIKDLSQNNLKNEFSIGSYGLIKDVIKINHGTNKNSYHAVYSITHSDGYRNNNQYDRQTFTFNTEHIINDKNEISILTSYINLKAFIPSSLNETDYTDAPKKASFTWGAAKGFEDSKRGLIGLSWQHKYNNKLSQSTSVFSSFRNGYEPRPFNILKEKTFAYGFRTKLMGVSKLFNKTLDWIVGGETFKDNYKSRTFENLYQDFPPEHGSVKGNELSNFKEKRNYYNLFFESNYKINEKTNISVGLNFNQTSYNLSDRFEATDSSPNQSGNYNFSGILSPKMGITHRLSKNLSLFSNISHGFSPISLEETLLPDGQINTSLKPETGWNYEIGSRGYFAQSRLQFEFSIFSLNIKNLLVARRTSEDQFIGLNAGKTKHNGLELNLNYSWINNQNLQLNSYVSYTHNDFSFKTFIDDENDFSGNELTGVPSDILNTTLDFNWTSGFYGNINFQYVESMPITDSNTLYSDSYNLTNLKLGYKTNTFKKLHFNIYLGLNNIFDETYASQILINASSFGGRAPRYYYPGNPTNYFAGININYNF